MKCQAIENGKECTKDATHIGTVLNMKDGLVEVLACEKHSKRKGYFGEKLEEANS